jgi:hypothetical protein
MQKIFLLVFTLVSLQVSAQNMESNIAWARRYGFEITKQPVRGSLKVEVSEEYPNVVLVYLCDYRGSVPIACREDYDIKLTTVTGRVIAITDYKETSFGTIKPNEFPLTIEAKVKGVKGEDRYPLEFSLKLLYKNFCYRIYLYDK